MLVPNGCIVVVRYGLDSTQECYEVFCENQTYEHAVLSVDDWLEGWSLSGNATLLLPGESTDARIFTRDENDWAWANARWYIANVGGVAVEWEVGLAHEE